MYIYNHNMAPEYMYMHIYVYTYMNTIPLISKAKRESATPCAYVFANTIWTPYPWHNGKAQRAFPLDTERSAGQSNGLGFRFSLKQYLDHGTVTLMTERTVSRTVNRLYFWIFAFTIQIYPNGFGLDRSASTPAVDTKVEKQWASLSPPLVLKTSNII